MKTIPAIYTYQTVCHKRLSTRNFHSSVSPRSAADKLEWPKSSNPTPYEIFGLPPTASPAEIKKRYYQLARKYHPDSRASNEAHQGRLQRFRQVVQANELLSTARSRRIYDTQGFGWGDINVNDIMGDPAHWQGNYEGRFRASGTYRGTSDGDYFNGNQRAQPYYTSNGNFAGGIIVIMVLAGVIQLSHIQRTTQKSLEKRRIVHEQASLNLRDARSSARGRKDMIDAFQERRAVKPGIYSHEDLRSL